MEIDPRGTVGSIKGHARHAQRSVGRLLVSGLGFSVAYFFDPDKGQVRRANAISLIGRLRRSRAGKVVEESGPGLGEATGAPIHRPLAHGTANGARSSARW
jgi:hypothetical protein